MPTDLDETSGIDCSWNGIGTVRRHDRKLLRSLSIEKEKQKIEEIFELCLKFQSRSKITGLIVNLTYIQRSH